MATEFLDRCEVIEECYEFLLAYAGQGLPSDEAGQRGGQVRNFLQRAAEALTGLAESCRRAVRDSDLTSSEQYEDFYSMYAPAYRKHLIGGERQTRKNNVSWLKRETDRPTSK